MLFKKDKPCHQVTLWIQMFQVKKKKRFPIACELFLKYLAWNQDPGKVGSVLIRMWTAEICGSGGCTRSQSTLT